jgi:phosphoglycolate phosphatase-like HAD superfamily hydrolase
MAGESGAKGANGVPMLVLDFDGVICDSIEECFVSSWTAWHVLYRGEAAREAPAAAHETFTRLRPFTRTGEDFPLLQQLIADGVTVRDQADFDAAARAAGPQTMKRYRELYYQARTELLQNDRARWLSLNRVYPHMARALAVLLAPPMAPLYIVSTKKTPFIIEVLGAAGIVVPAERIFLAEQEPKLVTVERLRRDGGFENALFVEDQIDTIKGNTNPRIAVRLASWGYVREEWLAEPRAVTVVTAEEFLAFVQQTYGRR